MWLGAANSKKNKTKKVIKCHGKEWQTKNLLTRIVKKFAISYAEKVAMRSTIERNA